MPMKSISNNLLYKIIRYYIVNGNNTIYDLSKEIDLSIPTTSKLVAEMCEAGYLCEYGKLETSEGRRPYLYGLNADSSYFLGVDTTHDSLNIGLMNFRGDMVDLSLEVPFQDVDQPQAIDDLAKCVNDFLSKSQVDSNKIKSLNINISGRVNPISGYSYSWLNFSEEPLSKVFSDRLGFTTFIDNDSRAMTYGEFNSYGLNRVQNMVFVNLSWGLGMGIIMNGQLYTGKSGFAGELGHIHSFDNEILCRCGKKGCLETEASGQAFYREVMERLKNGEASSLQKIYKKSGEISLSQIIKASNQEDPLCAEVLEEIGNKLGEHLSGILNLFNPELLVIGGRFSQIGDRLLHHINTGIMKYSLNLVSQDTEVRLSKLKEKAGVVGACMLARRNALVKELLE